MKTITRYKMNFILEVLMSFVWGFGLLIFSFVIDPARFASSIGTNYFSFLIVGIAFQAYTGAAVWGSPYEVQSELTTGQVEYTFASPVKMYYYMLSYSISQALIGTVFDILPMFTIGAIFAQNLPSLTSLLMALFSIILTFLVLSQLGVIITCLLLIFKNVSALNSFLNFLFQVATGMLVPIQFMPKELKALAFVIPLTHGMDLTRHFVIGSNTIWSIEVEFSALVIFLILLTLVAKFSVSYVEKKAKIEGLSLA
ncbi:MAG: ABC transporter permease [Candidatus Brockarchaeota archaeon]|nr:ABC transporter permease [Candidatus Brockarchaeota archaeon]